MPWEDVDLDSLKDAARYAQERNRALLVTLEPWSWSPASPVTPTELRDGILAGEHDDQIRSLCGALGGIGDPVTVRWGHEMDLKNGRYPWSDWRPSDYVAAYRHFVDLCREEAPDLAFMWSPRGEFDLGLYYPGDDYVDEIGLSIFGFQTYDVVANGGERDLTALLEPSYDRAVKFDKPIYISEFGCSGDRAYVKRCNDFSAATLKRFPKLEGVIYYSAVEPGEWPAVYGKPDWRVRPGTGLLSEAK
jgi:endoglucanase